MKRKNRRKSLAAQNAKFKKSLVSYVMTIIFFGFLFLWIHLPAFVFFIIVIPMTIDIIHKYIDLQSKTREHYEEDPYEDDYDFHEDDEDEEPLDLEEMKTMRKEWKDSDFV